MKKILLVGCPGGGKSTLAKQMRDILGYPLLHLDFIYHIDNENHITREELMDRVYEFDKNNDKWIIDGNFKTTFEKRIPLCDTIIFLNIDSKTCVENIIKRSSQQTRSDMAIGFDNSILSDEFITFVKTFETEVLPVMMATAKAYSDTKKLIVLNNYKELDNFVKNLAKQL